MIGIDLFNGIEYMDRLKEKRAKDELIPMIIKILQWFSCEQCANCCRNARIDLSSDEAVEILRHSGKAYFDMLDSNTVRDRLKPPCGLLKGNMCSVYTIRPASFKIYPFIWIKRGLLVLYQCPMGREVTEGLIKFAKLTDFKIETTEPEKGIIAAGPDGKVIPAAIVPYTLLMQYYNSMRIL